MRSVIHEDHDPRIDAASIRRRHLQEEAFRNRGIGRIYIPTEYGDDGSPHRHTIDPGFSAQNVGCGKKSKLARLHIRAREHRQIHNVRNRIWKTMERLQAIRLELHLMFRAAAKCLKDSKPDNAG
jgi:hypothetical protein